MKFKEIEPEMVIHCKTEEEANQLLSHLNDLGYEWYNGESLLEADSRYENCREDTCYCLSENNKITYSSVSHYMDNNYKITEFSDLVVPEEMRAEEVLKILHRICEKYRIHAYADKCKECPLYSVGCTMDHAGIEEDADKVIEICRQWKAEHEKPEREIVWIWQGRILELADGSYQEVAGETYNTECEYAENAEDYMA